MAIPSRLFELQAEETRKRIFQKPQFV